MPKSIDITGKKFNMLTAICKTGKQTPNKQYIWKCQCDCGNVTEVNIGNITGGRTKSCGCLNKRKGKDSPKYKHGLSILKGTKAHKIYQRECFDRFKYNLEPEQKQAMIAEQNNSCSICGYVFGQKLGDMKVDHCHTTGQVRGLLCDKCNRGLGYFNDNQIHLKNAATYLKYSNAR